MFSVIISGDAYRRAAKLEGIDLDRLAPVDGAEYDKHSAMVGARLSLATQAGLTLLEQEANGADHKQEDQTAIDNVFDKTPDEDGSFTLAMWDGGEGTGDSLEEIELSRDEYNEVKRFVAKLRVKQARELLSAKAAT